ncbi:LysR family transcriptional regulator [Rheinheimera soli]|uniref:LysR family transcriptional regulator n=1 Tax=Rheinheimera soli TaxID=443616 RepID=UPI001E32B82D|nr:LysR family transcriptional regulator [Rheinheimera soli]
MLPPLKALQAFEATARLKSFSKAAEQLFVTQSAISHQVKLLEDFIGQPLLLRQNKSVELTQSGDMLYSVVRDCFVRLNSVTQHLLNQPPVQLKILAQTSIAVEWLAPDWNYLNSVILTWTPYWIWRLWRTMPMQSSTI